jgi:hypothetical protein
VGRQSCSQILQRFVAEWRLALLLCYVAIASILVLLSQSPPRAGMAAGVAAGMTMCSGPSGTKIR